MFTVDQFQQAASSQDSNSDSLDVYIVRPTAIWESLDRFKRFASTYSYLAHPSLNLITYLTSLHKNLSP